MTVGDVLRSSTEYLEGKGIESPRLESELLLSHALGLSRLELYTQHDRPLNEPELASVRALLRRRGAREPLAYVLGEWGFRRLVLKTDARALVPRPETEIVVDRALAAIAGLDEPRVVDVGTGTGAIALAIADEHPGARVVATDVSEDALALARENAERLGLAIELRQADLLDGVAGPVALVVSNPPYVTSGELAGLEPEVRDFEPELALREDGQTRALAQAAAGVLAPGGALVLEIHEERSEAVVADLGALGYDAVEVVQDLAGRDRVVEARWMP